METTDLLNEFILKDRDLKPWFYILFNPTQHIKVTHFYIPNIYLELVIYNCVFCPATKKHCIKKGKVIYDERQWLYLEIHNQGTIS